MFFAFDFNGNKFAPAAANKQLKPDQSKLFFAESQSDKKAFCISPEHESNTMPTAPQLIHIQSFGRSWL